MTALLIILLILFLVTGVAGAVIEGLFWLLVISAVLLLLTGFLARGKFSRKR